MSAAAKEIVNHGYDPMEHPYVLAQAERIAELEAALRLKQDQWEDQCKKTVELEAEVERLRAANRTLAWKVAQCTEAAEKAEAEVERLKAELKERA